MNILWISHEYPPIGGGGATVCRAISRRFAALGHNVAVVSAAYKDGHTATPCFETTDGVDIYRLKCARSSKDQSTFFEMLSFLLTAFRFVPNLVQKRKIEAVYIYFGIPSGPLGWYVNKRFKIPYVICVGGGDVPGTQKRFLALYAILSPFLKMVWKNAAYVVPNSQKLKERAERFYSKARFTVIYSGADISRFPEAKTFNHSGQLRMLTTARILERKGIQHVIEALPRLIKETDGNISYTIIGDGPYRKEIESLAERLEVTRYIEITGMLPYDEYISRVLDADLFVLTSHWEGMPCAVTEAMAAHLPVIMSNCEGSAELVDGNGYILEHENIADKLAGAVLTLYNDRQLVAKMGNRSYELACGRFRWEKCAAEFLQLINDTKDTEKETSGNL